MVLAGLIGRKVLPQLYLHAVRCPDHSPAGVRLSTRAFAPPSLAGQSLEDVALLAVLAKVAQYWRLVNNQQQLLLLELTGLPSPGRMVAPGLLMTGWLAILQSPVLGCYCEGTCASPGQEVLAAGRACHLFLISAAMVMKACSTLVAFLALVSKKGMPISSANACTPMVA